MTRSFRVPRTNPISRNNSSTLINTSKGEGGKGWNVKNKKKMTNSIAKFIVFEEADTNSNNLVLPLICRISISSAFSGKLLTYTVKAANIIIDCIVFRVAYMNIDDLYAIYVHP